MKVLVTGANGFLGQHVVDALLRSGCAVVAGVRTPAAAQRLPRSDLLEVRYGDLRVDPLGELLAGVDVVVHCAAQVAGSDEARFRSTAVGTERLLSAIDGSSVSRLVLISSYSVYDWEAAAGRLDESTPVVAWPYGRDGYTVAKSWQERLVLEFATRSTVDVAVLRPGFVWGPGNEELAGAGLRVGGVLMVVGPRTKLPLTYVTNCAEAVAAAVERPPVSGTVLNIVDGPGMSAWSYSARLATWDPTLRARVPVPYAAFSALVRLLAALMPRVFRHGGKLPSALAQPSFVARFRPLDHGAARAMETLQWRPRVDLDSALRATFPPDQPGPRVHDAPPERGAS